MKKFCHPWEVIPERSWRKGNVNNSGDINWHKGHVFVSEVLRNEEIRLRTEG